MRLFSATKILLNYIQFLLRSKTEYHLHSPFFYNLYVNVIKDDRQFYVFDQIEKRRTQLLDDHRIIKRSDFGAGSKTLSDNKVLISQIAKTALSGKYQCRVLFRIVEHLKPGQILELGSSLGISTAYLGSVSQKSVVTSVEGDPSIAKIATKTIKSLKLGHVQILNCLINDALRDFAREKKKFDLVFIDGHHEYDATIEYVQSIQDLLSPGGIIIVDDIYWSKGMNKAWKGIKKFEKVRAAVDLFFCGFLFYSEDFKEKLDLKLRPDKIRFQ